MHILLLFVDGLGIGDQNKAYNPVYASNTPGLNRLSQQGILVNTCAGLGVDGLPQSATGQTAILTGVNGAQILGRHLNGFPTKTLREIILKYSIFKRLRQKGFTVTNANMFSSEYLRKILNPKPNERIRMSATTVSTLAGEITFRTEEDMLAGKAVYQDITNEILIEKGHPLPYRSPYRAGEILAELTRAYNFVLFEYFQTDIAGHSQDFERCSKVIETLDKMICGVIDSVNLEETLIVLTSDHGNIEDLRVKTHTRNKVPTMLLGKGYQEAAESIHSILDISHTIENLLVKYRCGGKYCCC